MRDLLQTLHRDHILRGWAAAELSAWRGGIRGDRHDDFNANHRSIFILDIEGPDVQIRSKPGLYDRGQPTGATDHPYVKRVELYRDYLHNVLAHHGATLKTSLAFDVDDDCGNQTEVPVFSFQKKLGDSLILLPDPDFLWTHHYASSEFWSLPDKIAYADKANAAIFSGSTSGAGTITMQALRDNSVPRLRAARYFKPIDGIDFYLPKIVQCADQTVEAAIRQEGFGIDYLYWKDQLPYKFVITLDGNGATCSRVYVALRSNSVAIKYESVHQLFYFRGLVAGRHYLAVRDDEEVVRIVEAERAHPGRHARIAAQGQRFAERFLTKPSLARYTFEVLTRYVALQAGEGGARLTPRSP